MLRVAFPQWCGRGRTAVKSAPSTLLSGSICSRLTLPADALYWTTRASTAAPLGIDSAMTRSADSLLRDAMSIWQAGVDAVRSDRLVRNVVRIEGETLCVGEQTFDLASLGRIAVVGGGKAGAGMAAAIEQIMGPERMEQNHLEGWVNVPADCVCPLSRIHLHAARPAGVNEPRPEGVVGCQQMLPW